MNEILNDVDAPCFTEVNKPQRIFKHRSYNNSKCENCQSDYKSSGRNSRIVMTTTDFAGFAIDFMESCVKCAKVYKEMIKERDA